MTLNVVYFHRCPDDIKFPMPSVQSATVGIPADNLDTIKMIAGQDAVLHYSRLLESKSAPVKTVMGKYFPDSLEADLKRDTKMLERLVKEAINFPETRQDVTDEWVPGFKDRVKKFNTKLRTNLGTYQKDEQRPTTENAWFKYFQDQFDGVNIKGARSIWNEDFEKASSRFLALNNPLNAVIFKCLMQVL